MNMEKKRITGDTLKARLKASARDRVYSFALAQGAVFGVIMNGTRMLNEMRVNHELGILETLVLGRAYLGVGLMAAELKGQDRIGLRIQCSGPIKGLVAEANAFGEVRGFLKEVPIPIERPMDDTDLSSFFGAGSLSVTRYLKDAKQPFTGQVMLKYGNIAKDLANYYLESEQIPTAFNLSINFDKEGNVTGAGGLFLQAMPGIDDEMAEDLEGRVAVLPSLAVAFAKGDDPQDFVRVAFDNYSPDFLSDQRIEFMCHCNKEKLRGLLMLMHMDQLDEILTNGPFPLEMRCHHCNTGYRFHKQEIQEIYVQRFSKN
jgi:molecular chaperone Hsp33